MLPPQFNQLRSPLCRIDRRLSAIQVALEGIDRTLRLLVVAQGQPRCFVDDQCPADIHQSDVTPNDGALPVASERSAA